MSSKAEFESKHLAQLHALAAEAGVPRYRMMRRQELIEELLVRGAEAAEAPGVEEAAPRPRARRGRRGARGRRGPARAEPEREGAQPVPEEGEVGSGTLDVLPAGHGMIRLTGLEPRPDDVYISASQIRRCELRSGDLISGPIRSPRRGERHRALVQVESVNGGEPGVERPPPFEELTAITPSRRLPLAPRPDQLLVRGVELLVPLAFGQRVLVEAEPRSGRTTLLRGLVEAITAAPDPPALIVVLIDERPEEVTEWRRSAPSAEIASAAGDLPASDQVRHAELAIAKAKRLAESGQDVVVIVDSLTRLGVAYADATEVKPVFGAGRDLEEPNTGSLTVIATVLLGTDEGDAARRSVKSTETAAIALDRELAAAGISPPLDVNRCEIWGEEAIRDPTELEAAQRLRGELRALAPRAAAELLAERLGSTQTNAELLAERGS